MRTIFYLGVMTVGIATAFGQGSLVFDQQAITISQLGGSLILNHQPMGQSFTPSLSAVGFVQFQFLDSSGSSGATISVNLLANSITGSVVAATSLVQIPNGFFGATNFYFQSNISVVAGTEYFLVPVYHSGDNISVLSGLLNYSGGSAYFSGNPSTPGLDFWFREGIVVPEPSLGAFGLVSGFSIFVFRKFRKN